MRPLGAPHMSGFALSWLSKGEAGGPGIMGADRLLSLVLGLALAGCATPMTLREIQAVKPNCARIDRQIAALEKEKAENDQRLLAGIQSVAPALAALNLVAGTYGRNVAIATGDWAAAIDRKLVELRRAKKSC
jgi:hypothetical protein